MPTSGKQVWSPDQYAENARFVSDLGAPVVELLAPIRGERILDLGCGDGALTVKLAGYGCEVVAVDSSPEMIEAAKALGLDARIVDGQELPFEREFDAVFTNAALHWMKNPAAVIAGVERALKPGGRFVGEFGGRGNVAAIVAAVESALGSRGLYSECPWYFPGAEEYSKLLEENGFSVQSATLIPRPTPLPGDVGNWIETLAQPYVSVIPDSLRGEFLREVVESLRPVLCDGKGNWHADYVRLRFCARKG